MSTILHNILAMLAVAFLLCCLAQYSFATNCNTNEEMAFTQQHLGKECRSKLQQLLDFNNPSLKMDSKLLDSLCTSACLEKYADWLVSSCNDTNKASLITASCLQQEDSSSEKRCRFFFPDFTEFISTHQCAQYFINQDNLECSVECREPLRKLVMELGCCFQSVYNDGMVVASLHEQGFLNTSQLIALNSFHRSDVLESCLDADMTPSACSSQPFLTVSGRDSSAAQGTGSRGFLFSIAFFVALISTLSQS